MTHLTKRAAKAALLLALTVSLAGCGLPRSGPNKKEIFAGSVLREGDAFIVSVNDQVTRATAVQPALGFSSSFTTAGTLGSDTINAGDVLGLTIYENVESGLLSATGMNMSQLAEVQVDGDGFIFVPYAGRVKAAGNSPEAIRRIITEKLDSQTPDPQVMVTRVAGDGASVSLTGAISGQGVYPIERPTRTLSSMIARAGGVAIAPDIARIKVVRGNQVGEIWFNDLFSNPQNDIALRNGDRIFVEEDTRSYTALGATGTQSRVAFDSQELSALEAIAQVGGLNPALADPTGVFIMRNEPAEIAASVLGRSDLVGAQRMVYVLDLTEPNGMFMARDFIIRDSDTVYVTEAPFSQWSKTVSALTGVATSADSLNTLAGN
ncbi:Polysaccharide biosynthesis/export protein [Aquimixticola soesokkakensis]|uniref:Polysaccharide biosynthesis/export protein n=1 Tax=Aquimixticola soesokkakensis TaxID=1519096 RepID=A0A1Y5SE71_9RHOB|nr:polysaccharide biosynthesis/export family protein [Aquimixticola soesokkakensis]SLN37141.1 Polysaccharide biosynthesis/export protein [Aquimixticola soesokkakensis]